MWSLQSHPALRMQFQQGEYRAPYEFHFLKMWLVLWRLSRHVRGWLLLRARRALLDGEAVRAPVTSVPQGHGPFQGHDSPMRLSAVCSQPMTDFLSASEAF